MKVPIENVFRMLCYAWGYGSKGTERQYSSENIENGINFLSRALLHSTHEILKRGLNKGYSERRESTRTIRGAIDFPASISSLSFDQGLAVCVFEEFSDDRLENQILKATLELVLRSPKINSTLALDIKKSFSRFSSVSSTQLSSRIFGDRRLARVPKQYHLPLQVCRFLFENSVPSSVKGVVNFPDFVQDDRQMEKIFEAFVRNFFAVEQTHFAVKAERFRWHTNDALPIYSDVRLIPGLITDISLTNTDRKIIIDTKYMKGAFRTAYRSDRKTFISAHINQIMAYLKNAPNPTQSKIEGILLYPSLSKTERFEYMIHDHRLSIVMINFDSCWSEIYDDLLRAIA